MSEQSAQLQRRGKHWRQHGTKKNGRIGNEQYAKKKVFLFYERKNRNTGKKQAFDFLSNDNWQQFSMIL